MPVQLTYPGVYIEELASGQHGITPVATSIAAFVGRAPTGPTDVPATIFSYGDFNRQYGGLQFDYPLSYAVKDFFDNGGSQAVIARLFEPVAPGDGVARLKFPGAGPMLPDGWVVDKATKPGDTQIAVLDPTGKSEGDPDIGMQFKCVGDQTTLYTVTGYVAADVQKKTPAMLTVAPAIVGKFQKCTVLKFSYGPSPSGWNLATVSGSGAVLTGGTGIPDVGQQLVFTGDAAVYTVIGEPKVTGADPSALQVTVPLSAKPSAAVRVGAVAIADPAPLPMPDGWEIDAFTAGKSGQGSITLINGTNAPLPGDRFSFAEDETDTVYVVTGFAPADAKTLDTLSFRSLTGNPIDPDAFCACCAPEFERRVPSQFGIKTGAKAGDTSFVYATSNASSGTVDIGDSFQIDGTGTEYSVRYVDSAAHRVYFLPEASLDFSANNAITFYPALSLIAANPGEWGNLLTATADTAGITDKTAAQFKEFGLAAEDLFNLTLQLSDARGRPVSSERYLNLSVKAEGKAKRYPNRVDRVLKAQSNLAWVDRLSAIPPANGAATIGIGGDDGQYLSTETYLGDDKRKTGIYLLKKTDLFNMLCIPPDGRILDDVPASAQELDSTVAEAAAHFCTDRRAFFIMDPPVAWKNMAVLGQLSAIDPSQAKINGMNGAGIEVARNAAVFFPRVWKEDILMKSQSALFAPSGAIAGVFAATDVSRGVWKAPAGMDAGLANVTKFEVDLDDDENGLLNPLGINCLRSFPVIGPVIWGSRTLRGADQFEDDYKYIPVRRLTLFIEESLKRGTEWAVFEPNDEALWSSLRLSVGSFMADLSRKGAFYNYRVACDAKTTTPDDIERGIVNVAVQFAPVKPAEFVVLQIQQTTAAA